MGINYKEIRENARHSLKGNWKLAILISLVYSFVSVIGDFIPESRTVWVTILSAISNGLFIFGYTAIIMHIVRGENTEFSEIFDGCRRFLKGLGMTLLVGIYTGLWTLLLIVPGIIATIKYSMTFYIWTDNPDISINEAISRSIEMTEGHKLEIFKLVFSFIGWIALILVLSIAISFCSIQYFVVIVSIGMIFLSPYIEIALGVFYTKLVKEMESKTVF